MCLERSKQGCGLTCWEGVTSDKLQLHARRVRRSLKRHSLDMMRVDDESECSYMVGKCLHKVLAARLPEDEHGQRLQMDTSDFLGKLQVGGD